MPHLNSATHVNTITGLQLCCASQPVKLPCDDSSNTHSIPVALICAGKLKKRMHGVPAMFIAAVRRVPNRKGSKQIQPRHQMLPRKELLKPSSTYQSLFSTGNNQGMMANTCDADARHKWRQKRDMKGE